MHFTRTLVRHASDVVALKVGWLTNFKMLVPVCWDLEWCGVGVCCGAMGLSCAKGTWTSDHLTLLSVESLPVSPKCKVMTRHTTTRRSSKRSVVDGRDVRFVAHSVFMLYAGTTGRGHGSVSAKGTSVSLSCCPRGAPWLYDQRTLIFDVLMTQRGPSLLRHRRRHWQQSTPCGNTHTHTPRCRLSLNCVLRNMKCMVQFRGPDVAADVQN